MDGHPRTMSKIWDYYGSRDPHYGVLSAPEFRAGRMTPEVLARFFESGVEKVDSALSWTEAAFGPVSRGVALDYGCGVGRLTKRLVDHFDLVVAADTSDGMLKITGDNLAGRNVKLEHASSMAEDPVNFILSMLVFQHIPPTEGEIVLRRLARRLNGSGAIDMPIRYRGGFVRSVLRVVRSGLQSVIRSAEPRIPMYVYNLERVRSVLAKEGCTVTVNEISTPLFDKAVVLFHRTPPSA
jgi:SAM-dependent methyltransferase